MNRALLFLVFLGLVHGIGHGRPAWSLDQEVPSPFQLKLIGADFNQVGFGTELGTLIELEEFDHQAVMGRFSQWEFDLPFLGIRLCDSLSVPAHSFLFASLYPRAPPKLS